jgi:hypothetical protein
MIHEGGPSEREYSDTQVTRGFANYYYLEVLGDPAQNTGQGLTPTGPLVSSRIWTQTYDPAFLKRAPGTPGLDPNDMSGIRVVPNPYSISAARFPGEEDKIAFYNIPGYCTIKIYTELGELIRTIEHTDGSGDASWNSITSSNQVVVSGIYIAVIENTVTGERVIKKLSIIR